MGVTQARIAVDAMGGDYAPDEIVKGAILAREQLGIETILVGDEPRIRALLSQYAPGQNFEVEPASDVIAMEDDATVVRRKPQASINVAMNLVKQGRATAVVSAGHSGAVMASALFRLGRIPGIERPAIGALFPTAIPNQQVLVLDVGAQVECKPRYLEQFAVMGSVYSQDVLGVASPRVGLINIGEEETKGNEFYYSVHQLLKANREIRFVGNAEGRDVLSGNFDVIVCDGFVGNVMLKFLESVGSTVLGILKEELPRGKRGKLGATILKRNLKRIKQRMDHAEHGGALLLGVNGICIISHGSAKAPSIVSALRLASEASQHGTIAHLTREIAGMMTTPPSASVAIAAPAIS